MKRKKKEGVSFGQAVNNLCETIIDHEKQAYQSKPKLQPFKVYAEKLRSNITNSLQLFRKSFQNGYHFVIEYITKKKPLEERAIYDIANKLGKDINNPDDFFDLIEDKGVLQAVFGYSEEMMIEIYGLALHFFDQKKYDNCIDVFVFLVTLNPYIPSFWQGLARTWSEQQRFEEALNAYVMAIDCDPYRLSSYRDAARCCLDFKSYDKALMILNHGLEAVDVCENEAQLKKFKDDLEAMKAYINSLKSR